MNDYHPINRSILKGVLGVQRGTRVLTHSHSGVCGESVWYVVAIK